MFLGLGFLVSFPSFHVPKINVDTFESYYIHLHSLRKNSLGYWIRTMILIKD